MYLDYLVLKIDLYLKSTFLLEKKKIFEKSSAEPFQTVANKK